MEHEAFWKEVVVLALIAIFSTFFFYGIDSYAMYWIFTGLALVFYFITRTDEKDKESDKNLVEYFHHASSHFLVSALFFLASYFMLYYTQSTFMLVLLSIAVILFSVGFMELLFERLEK